MKKRTIKHLSLGKKTISTFENNVAGGAPTTKQSQYCPQNPLPWSLGCPHSLDEAVCTSRSCDSDCYSRCNGC